MSLTVTIDFHDTLFRCDEWFALEVRDLPVAFLDWLDARHGRTPDDESRTRIDSAYRDLRREIKEHGCEDDARGCLRQVFGRTGISVSDDDLSDGVDALFTALPDATPLPGSMAALVELNRRGVTVGIISSAIHTPYLHRSVERAGFGPFISRIATSASTGYYKTRSEIYTSALIVLGADAARTIHVGDSLAYDVAGAARAGMRTAWLSHGQTRTSDDPEPDLTLVDWDGAAERIIGTFDRLTASATGSKPGPPAHVDLGTGQ